MAKKRSSQGIGTSSTSTSFNSLPTMCHNKRSRVAAYTFGRAAVRLTIYTHTWCPAGVFSIAGFNVP